MVIQAVADAGRIDRHGTGAKAGSAMHSSPVSPSQAFLRRHLLSMSQSIRGVFGDASAFRLLAGYEISIALRSFASNSPMWIAVGAILLITGPAVLRGSSVSLYLTLPGTVMFGLVGAWASNAPTRRTKLGPAIASAVERETSILRKIATLDTHEERRKLIFEAYAHVQALADSAAALASRQKWSDCTATVNVLCLPANDGDGKLAGAPADVMNSFVTQSRQVND